MLFFLNLDTLLHCNFSYYSWRRKCLKSLKAPLEIIATLEKLTLVAEIKSELFWTCLYSSSYCVNNLSKIECKSSVDWLISMQKPYIVKKYLVNKPWCQLNIKVHLSTSFILYCSKRVDHQTEFICKKKRSLLNLCIVIGFLIGKPHALRHWVIVSLCYQFIISTYHQFINSSRMRCKSWKIP